MSNDIFLPDADAGPALFTPQDILTYAYTEYCCIDGKHDIVDTEGA